MRLADNSGPAGNSRLDAGGGLGGGGGYSIPNPWWEDQILQHPWRTWAVTTIVVTTAVVTLLEVAGAATVAEATEAATAEATTAAQVSARVANAAKHIFGPKALARHKLGGVLSEFGGDAVAATNALEAAAQQALGQGAKGVFETVVNVAGQNVTVRGAVMNGIARVSTAFIP